MAASGQELITSEEKATPVKPKAADPQAGTSESADRREHWLGETETAQDRPLHTDLEHDRDTL